MQIGNYHINNQKYNSIPTELIKDYLSNTFGPDMIVDIDDEGEVTAYRFPKGYHGYDLSHADKVWSWGIDSFIEELLKFDGGYNYYYDKNTYKWRYIR